MPLTEREFAEQMERSAYENHESKRFFSELFDLLILARNSKDEEALQEAIDMVAIAASKTDNF